MTEASERQLLVFTLAHQHVRQYLSLARPLRRFLTPVPFLEVKLTRSNKTSQTIPDQAFISEFYTDSPDLQPTSAPSAEQPFVRLAASPAIYILHG